MQTFIRLLVPLVMACAHDTNPSIEPDAMVPGIDGALPSDAAIPMPMVLVANEPRPSSIAVYLGDVYWTTDPSTGKGQVKKLVAGGAPVALAIDEDRPTSIVVGPGFINPTAFWVTGSILGEVRQIATSGAPPRSAVSLGDATYSLTLDGDSVFIGTRGLVGRKGLANTGGVTTLATGLSNVISIDADASGAVFGTRTSAGTTVVGSVVRAGGNMSTLSTSTLPVRDVEIAGSTVFFLDDTKIKRVARNGGSTTTLTTITENVPWSMVFADGKLFVATNRGVVNPSAATGQIIEIDATTGAQRVLASGQAEPSSIAVDASYVYWTNRGLGAAEGQIMRFAR